MRFKFGARRFTDLLLRVGANIVVHGSIICPDGITFPGGLLRTRDERPGRRAAERRYELSSPDLVYHSTSRWRLPKHWGTLPRFDSVVCG
jgi:hypothetical protein